MDQILAMGNPSGTPGQTRLDVAAPAERMRDIVSGSVLTDELQPSGGTPLVFYELEESDGGGRTMRLAKSGQDLRIVY